MQDLTEKNRAAQHRIQKEKLEGVLETAGAVCHELNQPLQSIMGYSQLLQMDLSGDHPLRPKLEKVLDAVEKLRQITSRLMNITRYRTMEYLGGSRIIDIEKSAGDGEP